MEGLETIPPTHCVVGMGSKRQVVLNDDTSVECSERLIGVRLFRQL